jgi:hypothetical protein
MSHFGGRSLLLSKAEKMKDEVADILLKAAVAPGQVNEHQLADMVTLLTAPGSALEACDGPERAGWDNSQKNPGALNKQGAGVRCPRLRGAADCGSRLRSLRQSQVL